MSKNINQSEQTKTVTSEFVNEGERIAELEKSVKSCYLILHTLAITMGFFSFGKFNCFLTFLLGFCIASWGNVLTCFGAMNDWNDDEVNTWSVTVTSVTNFGAMLGALFSGAFTKYGKKKMIIIDLSHFCFHYLIHLENVLGIFNILRLLTSFEF